MVGIAIKEVSRDGPAPRGPSIVRIPVSMPDGYKALGSNYCVVITELSYTWQEGETNRSWTGYPFVSMKH